MVQSGARIQQQWRREKVRASKSALFLYLCQQQHAVISVYGLVWCCFVWFCGAEKRILVNITTPFNTNANVISLVLSFLLN